MSNITAIKITAHHGEGNLVVTLSDAFNDIERAIDIFNELATEFDEIHFCDVKVTIEPVEDEDSDATASEQMRWLADNIKQGEDDTLDMVVTLLEDMQETVESFHEDENAFDAYCSCYGAHYLSPGERVSFIKYTRRQMIEAEIDSLCLDKDAMRAVCHLLDEDAVLAQAEQGEGVIEMGGNYYVFDN